MSETRYDNPFIATLSGLRQRVSGRRAAPTAPNPRLDGRRALVTGANRGLGRAIAGQLGALGAYVVMPCRSDGSATLAELRAAGGEGELLYVDLAELASIERLADALEGRFDVVVLNAGVVPSASRATADGFELQIGVNFLANVALMDRLVADGRLEAGARVVVVSSESHRSAEAVELDALGVADDYGIGGVMPRYGYSKLLLTSWAFAMDRATEGASFHTICPGPVHTDIAREAPAWSKPLLDPVMRAFFASAAEGAEPIVWIACARELQGQAGRYYHRFEAKAPSPIALDEALGERLLGASRALLRERRAKTIQGEHR